MGVETALYSGVSGLSATSNAMNVIGNNLANSQTTGFKANRSLFSDILASQVASANGNSQIGRGVNLSTVDSVFEQGSFKGTGVSTDMAIDGDGFFMVSNPSQDGNKYTRDGSFRFDSKGFLVNPMGYRVQGYGIDENGNVAGQLTDIQTNLNGSIEPSATTQASFETNLNQESAIIPPGFKVNKASAEIGNTTDTGTIDPSTDQPNAIIEFTEDIANAENGDTITVGLADGSSIKGTYDGTDWSWEKPSEDYTISRPADVFGSGKMGLDITLEGSDFKVASVESSLGGYQSVESNTVLKYTELSSGLSDGDSININLADGTAIKGVYDSTATEWSWEVPAGYDVTVNAADNEVSVQKVVDVEDTGPFDLQNPNETSNFISSVNVYDSLGEAHQVSVYFSKLGENEWIYNLAVPGGDVADGIAGELFHIDSGKLVFNENGSLKSGGTAIAGIQWANGAGDSEIAIDLGLTQYNAESALVSKSQNGFATGFLSDVSVDELGIITGSYTNGQSQQMAQVGLAKFANPNGLLRDGSNLFAETQASGLASVGPPGSGAGTIRANSLEQSNVDIAEQFTDMIVTQRIYQANSRSITTADEMLQEVVNLKR